MKQTDFTKEFLQKYRELESAVVRVMGDGCTVRDFEDTHPDMADRLRLLRQVRNYATHSTDISEILPVPQETVAYMDKVITHVLGPQKTVKKVMVRAKPLALDTPIIEAAKRLRLYPYLPIIDEEKCVCRIFTLEDLRCVVASGLLCSDIRDALGILKSDMFIDVPKRFVSPSIPAYDASQMLNGRVPTLIITSDGKLGGKYIGLFTGI